MTEETTAIRDELKHLKEHLRLADNKLATVITRLGADGFDSLVDQTKLKNANFDMSYMQTELDACRPIALLCKSAMLLELDRRAHDAAHAEFET